MEGSEEPVMRWAVFTTLCFTVRDRAVAMPHCDTVDKDALDGTMVEVHQNVRRQMDLFKYTEEEETPVSLWTPRNLKVVTRLTSVLLIQIGVCVPSSDCM